MNTKWIKHQKYEGYLFSPEGNCLSLKKEKKGIQF